MYFLKEIIQAINKRITDFKGSNCKRGPYLDTRIIRMILKVNSNNKSKTQFIWRALEYLAKEGYLKQIKGSFSSSKVSYIAPIKKIKLEEVLN